MSPETKLKNRILPILEREGFTVKVAGGHFQRAGLPDIHHTTRGGKSLWIELKVYPRKLEAIQEIILEQIGQKGGVGCCITYLAEGQHYAIKVWKDSRCLYGEGTKEFTYEWLIRRCFD